MPPLRIALKRAYEIPSDGDGLRILVERLWPRGLTKVQVALDHWVKDVAPSPELRAWYGHRPERWPEFQHRYLAELESNRAAVDELRRLCEGEKATFVFAAKDEARNSAVVLRDFLLSSSE